MNVLRALLNAPPRVANSDELSTNRLSNGTVKEESHEPLHHSFHTVSNVKLKKKAAFEAWHSKKFDEILNNYKKRPEEPENHAPWQRVSKKPKTTELSELRKILSAPSAFRGPNGPHPIVQTMNLPFPTTSSGRIENMEHSVAAQIFSHNQSLIPTHQTPFLPQPLASNSMSSFNFTELKNVSPIAQPRTPVPIRPITTTTSVPLTSIERLNNNISVVPKRQDDLASKALKAKRLTTPRLSRHNDAAYYPNIQCVLCKEWVCSRNRQMHIESHLLYRPYRCSACSYNNRKAIFITTHIDKTHPGEAICIYTPNTDLEKKAWIIAEKCLQHTRVVLLTEFGGDRTAMNHEARKKIKKSQIVEESAQSLLKENFDWILGANDYAARYRPKIFNAMRIEKTQIIEESRAKGLMPDLSVLENRETKCEICSSYVLSMHNVMEEHVRIHLPIPSYRCSFPSCTFSHNSKNFTLRHMKEVHPIKRHPIDIVQTDENLRLVFAEKIMTCFPQHYKDLRLGTKNIIANDSKYANLPKKSNEMAKSKITGFDQSIVQEKSEPKSIKSLYSTLSSLLFNDDRLQENQNACINGKES